MLLKSNRGSKSNKSATELSDEIMFDLRYCPKEKLSGLKSDHKEANILAAKSGTSSVGQYGIKLLEKRFLIVVNKSE